MFWANTIGGGFNGIPWYHDLGRRGEENAFLATNGTGVLLRVSKRRDKEKGTLLGWELRFLGTIYQ
jgi:hypothetical protein